MIVSPLIFFLRSMLCVVIFSSTNEHSNLETRFIITRLTNLMGHYPQEKVQAVKTKKLQFIIAKHFLCREESGLVLMFYFQNMQNTFLILIQFGYKIKSPPELKSIPLLVLYT